MAFWVRGVSLTLVLSMAKSGDSFTNPSDCLLILATGVSGAKMTCVLFGVIPLKLPLFSGVTVPSAVTLVEPNLFLGVLRWGASKQRFRLAL